MKNKIIKASIPLFDEKGYSETSIQDIVDSLGVTKGTFYYYYKSKQELLKDIDLNFINYMLEQQKFILIENTQSNEDKIYDVIYMIIRSIRTKKQEARTLVREIRHLEKTNLDEIKSKRREFRLIFQNLIEDGVRAGEFKDNIRSDLLAMGILGMTNWSYYWYNPDGEILEEELADMLMEMIKNGIKLN